MEFIVSNATAISVRLCSNNSQLLADIHPIEKYAIETITHIQKNGSFLFSKLTGRPLGKHHVICI